MKLAKVGFAFVGLCVGIASLSACGGGGGGGDDAAPSDPVIPTNGVKGTAASGAAITGAAVSLRDSRGTLRTATTDTSGHFSIATSDLAPPFVVRVQRSSGTVLYSVSTDTASNGVINVTPLTDLIIRCWYSVQGVSMDAAFESPVTYPPPAPDSVKLISAAVLPVVQYWLAREGVDTSSFNLISSPFEANHTGLDRVLDQTTVDVAAGTIIITDGATAQQSALTYSNAPATLTVRTNVSGPKGANKTITSTVVPLRKEEQSAIDGMNATLAALAQTVTEASAQLTSAALLPFFSSNYRDGGLPASVVATYMVSDLRGYRVTFRLRRLDFVDTNAGRVTATFDRVVTDGSTSSTERVQYSFTKAGDKWLLHGDQRLGGGVEVYAEARTYQGAIATGSGPMIRARATASGQHPADNTSVTDGTVSGGGIWNDTRLKPAYAERPDLLEYAVDSGPLSTPIDAGTPFTFALNLYPRTAGQVTYEARSNAFTSETIAITNLSGATLADAPLGQSLNVKWTLPGSYAVQSVKLTAIERFLGPNGLSAPCVVAGPLLSATATSGTLTVPQQCRDLPVATVDIRVLVEGVNGERSVAWYSFR